MLLAEKIKPLITWQNLIALIGLIIGLISLWPVFVKDKAHITYSIISNISVLDVKQPVSDLSIIFKGEDIQKKSLDLKILTVKITNDGDLDISQSMFDQDVPWGLSISSGKIIEHRLISNSDYLSTRLSPQQIEPDSLSFKKVIFEKGKSFSLELLILHPKNSSPQVSPYGKIMGIDKFSLIAEPIEKENQSIRQKMLNDSFSDHVLRFLIYTLSAFVCILILFLFLFLSIKIDIYRKKRIITKLSAYSQTTLAKADKEMLVTIYSEFGYKYLEQLRDSFRSPDVLNKVISHSF